MAVAINPNIASNMGKKRRRRSAPAGFKAPAVGLRRRGRAPASDLRRRSTRGGPGPLPTRPTPVAPRAQSRISPVEKVATPVSAPAAASTGKPVKPAAPAGQPPAYGARRKATLPPGLAKRTGGAMPGKPSTARAMPKPPKPPKRGKGY